MKIAVMGGGGIGSYVAALLSRAGHDVTMVCRGAHLQAIRAEGLQVRRGDEAFTVPDLHVTDDCESVGVVDVLVMAVKLYDLASASTQAQPMVGPGTLVVPIQNGVNAHEIISGALGADRSGTSQTGPGHVLAGTVFISALVERPGLVVGRGRVDRMVFGEPDGHLQPATLAFRDACVAAGIEAIASTRIVADLWNKFVVVVGTSAVCCLSRRSCGEVCADEKLTALLLQGFREAMQVAAALGIHVADDADHKSLAFVRTVDYNTRISMLEDIEHGRRTELDWMSGLVVQLAGRVGVPVPLHDVAVACLGPYSKGAPKQA